MKTDHELNHSIGFLLGITYRKLSTILHARLKPYDITPEQWSVLYHIDQAGGIIQKEIAERSGKDKSTTTRILDHLESKSLIYKKMGDLDRRSFVVYTTELGKSTLQATIQIEQGVTDLAKSCMTEEEFALLTDLLYRINHVADQTSD